MDHDATDVKDLLSISLMIQEANKISERHKLTFVSRCVTLIKTLSMNFNIRLI